MTQSVFSASPGSVTLLNQNFTQLYYLREIISDPSYTAAAPKLTFGAVHASLGGTPAAYGAGITAFGVDATSQAVYDLNLSGTRNATFTCTASLVLVGTVTALPLQLWTNNAVRLSIDTSGHVASGVDNTQTMGTAAKRWSVVYAGTGTINTSDAREKTAVQDLNAAELVAARRIASEIGAYQFLAAVAKKGEAARLHIGLTVQRAMAIMQSEGLDPLRYAFICHDAWPADEEAGTPAGDRYGFRPDELLLFIALGFEARLAALEAKAA